MGFDNYSDPLRVYLKKYRDALKAPSSSTSKKRAEGDAEAGQSPVKKQKVQALSPSVSSMQAPQGGGGV